MSYTQKLRQRAIKNQKSFVAQHFSPADVIKKFILTEKGYNAAAESEKKTYVFAVHHNANKNDVKNTLSLLYGVDVESVRTLVTTQKKRQSRGVVKKPYKKAYVTLKSGQEIPLSS